MPTNAPGYRQKKRDNWKTNYEHYSWTKQRIEYRSWLNKENRRRWTYWNGDNLDLWHVDDNPKNMNGWNLKKISQESNRKMWALKAIKHRKAKMARWGKY